MGTSLFVSEINWNKGEWKFSRCPDTCTPRACKTRAFEAGTKELELDSALPWEDSLDKLGEEDPDNPHINWVDIDNPDDSEQAEVIATMFKDDMDEDLDGLDEDTKNWKSHVPEWLYPYDDIFSERKSEQMPEHKPYNHPIDFVEGSTLPKPAKIYPLSPKE